MVGEGVNEDDTVTVGVAVRVTVLVGVLVRVDVFVSVIVGVCDGVAVTVGVMVFVGVGLTLGGSYKIATLGTSFPCNKNPLYKTSISSPE
jgi:hypothetical protein